MKNQVNEAPVKKKYEPQKAVVGRCSKCGFRIRGKDHESSTHHQVGKAGKASVGT